MDVTCLPDDVTGLSDDVIGLSISSAVTGAPGLIFGVVPCWLLIVACSAVLQGWTAIYLEGGEHGDFPPLRLIFPSLKFLKCTYM